MTLTETNQKFREEYLKQNKSVLSSIQIRKTNNENLEKIFEKFASEMGSVSKDFTLVKTEKTQEYKVYINGFPVNSHILTYYDFEIKYTGKLPEGTNSAHIKVDVSEHVVSRRRSWRSTNHGYKVRAILSYEESPYYKNGKSVAKKIIQYVDNLFQQYKTKQEQQNIDNRAYSEVSKQFPNKFIRIIKTNGGKSTFTVENTNNTKVNIRYHYNTVSDSFTFQVISVETPTIINLQNLVEKLASI